MATQNTTSSPAQPPTAPCTDKACNGDAKYALWMGDRIGFSRVHDPYPTMPYDDGDLHPYVCEDCLPTYRRLFGDRGTFTTPDAPP